MKRTPSLFPPAYFDIKELPQVVTQSGDKRGILPSRAVPGTPKTIDTPIRYPSYPLMIKTSVHYCSASQLRIRLMPVTCYPFYFFGSAPKRFVVHARKN